LESSSDSKSSSPPSTAVQPSSASEETAQHLTPEQSNDSER